MNKFLVAIIAVFALHTSVFAAEVTTPSPFTAWTAAAASVTAIELEIDTGNGEENARWPLLAKDFPVLFARLENLPVNAHVDDEFLPMFSPAIGEYHGIVLHFTTWGGEQVPDLRIRRGEIFDAEGKLLRNDPGWLTEYWLFGTAQYRHQQAYAMQIIPVFTFEQCKNLGFPIIHTKPRQCITPIDDILLEVGERPTIETLSVQDFDSCLKQGRALIDSFPRRCLVGGGRVFSEPARLIEQMRQQQVPAQPVAQEVSQ